MTEPQKDANAHVTDKYRMSPAQAGMKRTYGDLNDNRKRAKLRLVKENGVAANCVAGGQVAGIGNGNGEPGVDRKKKKRAVMGTLSRR